MAIITVICSGMMGSAITFPAAHNGHTIRLVGSPLDKDIIEHGKKTGEHLTLSLYRKNNDTNGTDAPSSCLLRFPSTISRKWKIASRMPI